MGGLTLQIEQGVERKSVGTKISEVLAGCSASKFMLASFLFATGYAQTLQIAHDLLVSIRKHNRIDVQCDEHFRPINADEVFGTDTHPVLSLWQGNANA